MLKIEKVKTLTLGTSAQTVDVGGRACMVQNLSESAVIYFKEKREDGKPVSASNGYAIGPGKEMQIPLVVMDLSLISDTASTDVRVLILQEV
jgi:hypothetical protein